MNKLLEISEVLSAMADFKGLSYRLSDEKIAEISERLNTLSRASRRIVKDKISLDDFALREVIDFSDIDFWIDQIADIINHN